MSGGGRVAWLAAGALLTVVAVTVGPATVGLWLARQTEAQQETHELAEGELTVEFRGVDIQVEPGTVGEVTVEHTLTWSSAKPRLNERWDGQTLRIMAECGPVFIGPPCDADYTLRVSPDTQLTIRGESGDLVIDDFSGQLSAQVTAGDVTVNGLRSAEAHLQTTSGDIRARFSQPPARVEAATTTGDIDLTVPPGTAYRMQITATEQRVDVPHDAGASRTIIVRSDRGSVRIR